MVSKQNNFTGCFRGPGVFRCSGFLLALGFVSLYNGKEQLGRDDVNRPGKPGNNLVPRHRSHVCDVAHHQIHP